MGIATGSTKAAAVRVLVVDDDVNVLRAINRRMSKYGDVDLITLNNSMDALLVVGSLKPDIIILDVLMPGINGLEVCRRIKAHQETRDVQVILVSGSMNEMLAAEAQAAGAERALSKPIDVARVLENTGVLQDAETVKLRTAIAAAKQQLHNAEEQLLQLQRSTLARGTRDVLEQAREAVKHATAAAEHDLDSDS